MTTATTTIICSMCVSDIATDLSQPTVTCGACGHVSVQINYIPEHLRETEAAIAVVEAHYGSDWKHWGNGPGQHRYTPSIIDEASCADPVGMQAALSILGIPYWDGSMVRGEFAAA